MTTPTRPSRRSRTAWLVALALLAAGLLACSSDKGPDDVATAPSASTPASTEATTSTAAATGGGLDAFCAAAPRPDEEVPESYVGSEEQVADLRALADIAPDAIADDVTVIADHFETEVDPADPDSQLTETFPDDVTASIDAVTTYVAETCDG